MGYNQRDLYSYICRMGKFEAFSQESSEIKETDWVQQQVKAELQDLQKESFYST